MTAVDAPFILLSFVRTQLDQFEDAGPPDILAERIAWQIPDHMLRTALAQALTATVRDANRLQRAALAHSPGPSRKGAALVWYERVLRQRECVDLNGGVWKFLGEMTEQDVETAAAIRQQAGERSLLIAERYRLLAKRMSEHGALVVADMSEAVLAEVLK